MVFRVFKKLQNYEIDEFIQSFIPVYQCFKTESQ